MTAPDAAASTQGRGLSKGSWREPLASQIFIASLILVLGLVLGARLARLGGIPSVPFGELAFWVVLVLVMNAIPFKTGELTFTLDTPLLLTIALLYPPELASIVAFVGSVDLREILRQVGPMRALFNRTQIALSVLIAGVLFRLVTGGALNPWTRAALGTAVALIAFHLVNTATVGIHTSLRFKTPLGASFKALTVGPVTSFLATYFGYGVLALVLAHLFLEVGPWSVALFLIPLVVGRQMLVRGEALSRLTDELRHRERLLERLFDRIVEERRDERLRIAAGLHDDVLQSLIRMAQLGSFLEDELSSEGQPKEDARELRKLSRETSDKLRRVLSDLQRSPVGAGGLVPSLKNLAVDLQSDWGVPVSISAEDDLAVSPETQLVGYHVVREAVINSLKHADASRVAVTMRQANGHFVAVVEDDGSGFDPESVDESKHFGLGLMRTRVDLVGGNLEVASHPDRGTQVTVTLPEPKEPPLGEIVVRGASKMPNGAG